MKDYKDKFEKATQQLYELKLAVNEQIDDYELQKSRNMEQQQTMHNLQTYNQSLINEMSKLTNEVEVLREANRVTLQMVRNADKQKWLLEEKYNATLEQAGDDYVLKKRYRGRDEERNLQDKIMDRLETELHGAYNAIEMSIHSQ